MQIMAMERWRHTSPLYTGHEVLSFKIFCHSLAYIICSQFMLNLEDVKGAVLGNITLELNMFIPLGQNLARDDSNIEHILLFVFGSVFQG